MTGLLIATILQLSPGIQLADSAGPRHLRLIEYEHRHTPPFYSEADELPQHVVEELNVEQLKGALDVLEAARPTYRLPSILLGAGLGAGMAMA